MKSGLICLACLFAALAARATITVAAYNVENYLITDRMVDGVFRQAYPKPEAEKTGVRKVIAGIAPDILALEEMGKQPFLDELRQDLKKEGVDYPYGTVLDAADPDRHVAVLSKLPLKDIRRHAQVPVTLFGKPDVVKRGVLEVTVATSEGDLTLFVLHLKSRRTERPDDPEGATQRQAEAEAVRDLVFSRFPDPTQAKFIVCGDWNDSRNTKAIRALLKRGETPLGELLRASDSRGEMWTHFYRAEDSYSRIDFILVSGGLKPLVDGGRARVFDGPSSTEGSDHRAVFVKLRADPVKP